MYLKYENLSICVGKTLSCFFSKTGQPASRDVAVARGFDGTTLMPASLGEKCM